MIIGKGSHSYENNRPCGTFIVSPLFTNATGVGWNQIELLKPWLL